MKTVQGYKKKKRLRDKRRKGASRKKPLCCIDLKRSERSQRKSATNISSLVSKRRLFRH